MSRSTTHTNPFLVPADVQAKVDEIVTSARLRFGHGDFFMSAAPPEPVIPTDPPEGVSKDEWDALGDPGKTAIVREREARVKAENDLKAVKAAKPAPPKPAPPKPAEPAAPAPAAGDAPDVEDIVKRAVEAAVKPFQEREEARDAAEAVGRIQSAVIAAAKETFQDTSDAVVGIDLTTVTDGNGGPDAAKIKTALEALLTAKPHLGKTPDGRLYAQPGFGAGAGEGNIPLETRVQTILGQMQSAAGIRPPAAS